jgi:hypothetical protein
VTRSRVVIAVPGDPATGFTPRHSRSFTAVIRLSPVAGRDRSQTSTSRTRTPGLALAADLALSAGEAAEGGSFHQDTRSLIRSVSDTSKSTYFLLRTQQP